MYTIPVTLTRMNEWPELFKTGPGSDLTSAVYNE